MPQRANQRLADFAQSLLQGADPFGALQSFHANCGVRGYRYAFGLLRSETTHGGLTQKFFNKDNLPAEWQNSIGAGNFIDDDPTVPAFLAGAEQFDWFPPGFRDVIRAMTPGQRRLVETELDLRMMYGMSLNLSATGHAFAAMGLWFEDQSSRKAFEKDWLHFGPTLRQAALLFDSHLQKNAPNAVIGLSPREVDCLSYLAGGLRPAEISHRMNIVEKTFEKHVANAKYKLKARTRDQAVAKAIVAGLLDL